MSAPILSSLRPSLAVAVAGFATLLLLAGCGGSDSSSDGAAPSASDSPSALSKADFIAQADAICKAGNAKLSEASSTLTATSTQEDFEAFVTDVAIPDLQSQHDELAALGVPAGDEDTISTMLGNLQTAIDDISADPSKMLTSSGVSPFEDANQLAQSYGLTECGSGA